MAGLDPTDASSPGSASKRSRYDDDSSDDDDLYSNFDKFVEKNKGAAQVEAAFPKYKPGELSSRPAPKLVMSSDSESDVEEMKEHSGLAALMAKGKKFNEEREKRINDDLKRIDDMAKVAEAAKGALPDMIYGSKDEMEAQSRLKNLKAQLHAAESRRSLDSSYSDCMIVGEGAKRYNSYESPNAAVSDTDSATFLLQDLHKNDTKIEKLDMDLPMRTLVIMMSQRWECMETEVIMTVNSQTLNDLSMTPRGMGLNSDGIHTLAAVFVPVRRETKPAEVKKDENVITIKFQSGKGKPAIIDVNKNEPFSSILDKVAEMLKMDKVGKLVFDCEKVDFNSTPVDLGMDDEECIDVYAA